MNRFVIAEPDRCIGCGTCMAACTATHKAQGQQSWPRLAVTRTAERTAPILCRHCEDAPCRRVCPVIAIAGGGQSVIFNEQTCIGCRMCALACPFGAITPSGTSTAGVAGIRVNTPTHSAALNALLACDIGVRSVAVKCDLCASDPAGPVCLRVCLTKALLVVDQEGLEKTSRSRKEAEVVRLGLNTSLMFSEEQDRQ